MGRDRGGIELWIEGRTQLCMVGDTGKRGRYSGGIGGIMEGIVRNRQRGRGRDGWDEERWRVMEGEEERKRRWGEGEGEKERGRRRGGSCGLHFFKGTVVQDFLASDNFEQIRSFKVLTTALKSRIQKFNMYGA
jgi:hypothetical protein